MPIVFSIRKKETERCDVDCLESVCFSSLAEHTGNYKTSCRKPSETSIGEGEAGLPGLRHQAQSTVQSVLHLLPWTVPRVP